MSQGTGRTGKQKRNISMTSIKVCAKRVNISPAHIDEYSMKSKQRTGRQDETNRQTADIDNHWR